MKQKNKITKVIIALYNKGYTPSEIVEETGFTKGKVSGAIYRLRKSNTSKCKNALRKNNGARIFFQGVFRITEEQMLRYPELDPRDLTGRFFGDPLPGRSSVYSKR